MRPPTSTRTIATRLFPAFVRGYGRWVKTALDAHGELGDELREIVCNEAEKDDS